MTCPPPALTASDILKRSQGPHQIASMAVLYAAVELTLYECLIAALECEGRINNLTRYPKPFTNTDRSCRCKLAAGDCTSGPPVGTALGPV